ncbi:MAG: DUF2283 domain-containing protein [Chloroflexota bacterium]|nr:DUF2283 domain-containing protein [Chloroflexota bacterium]
MTSPLVTYDPEVKALYLQFSEAEIAETLELSENVYIDVDSEGQPVGFEVLNATPRFQGTLPAPPDSAELRDLVKQSGA